MVGQEKEEEEEEEEERSEAPDNVDGRQLQDPLALASVMVERLRAAPFRGVLSPRRPGTSDGSNGVSKAVGVQTVHLGDVAMLEAALEETSAAWPFSGKLELVCSMVANGQVHGIEGCSIDDLVWSCAQNWARFEEEKNLDTHQLAETLKEQIGSFATGLLLVRRTDIGCSSLACP